MNQWTSPTWLLLFNRCRRHMDRQQLSKDTCCKLYTYGVSHEVLFTARDAFVNPCNRNKQITHNYDSHTAVSANPRAIEANWIFGDRPMCPPRGNPTLTCTDHMG